jgi:hypothetical protein
MLPHLPTGLEAHERHAEGTLGSILDQRARRAGGRVLEALAKMADFLREREGKHITREGSVD